MAKVAQCATALGNSDAPQLACLIGVVGSFINLAFVFLGAVCLIFLLYGAIKFITSQGDPKAIKSARDTMTYAVIGTALVLSTYIIGGIVAATFVANNVDIFKLPKAF